MTDMLAPISALAACLTVSGFPPGEAGTWKRLRSGKTKSSGNRASCNSTSKHR